MFTAWCNPNNPSAWPTQTLTGYWRDPIHGELFVLARLIPMVPMPGILTMVG